jgi:putative ABC transport system permease protein
MSILELIISLEMGLIYGIVAIGIYFTFRVIDFPDLTCDGSFVLGAATSAILIKGGYDPYFTLAVSIAAGMIAGLTTGILNIKFKISNLLSGIIVAFMLYSINLKVMQNVPNISLIDNKTIFTGSNSLLTLTLIALIIWIFCAYILTTDRGLALRIIGQNKRLALNSGVNVSAMTITCLMFSNALISLAGGIFAQTQGFADVSSGAGTVLIGFAAVIIGEKLLPFRSMLSSVLACIIGSIIYRILVAFALRSEWLGLETQDLNLITGIMIVGIMISPNWRKKSC